MNPVARLGPTLALMLCLAAGFGAGCGEVASGVTPTSINPTPAGVLNPQAPDEPKAEPSKKAEPTKPAPKAEPAKTTQAARSPALASGLTVALADAPRPAEAPADGGVRLVAIKFADLKGRIAANPRAKFTLVDIWSTTCPPCLENFPHVVEMDAKFAPKGLAVVSLSLDDPEDEKAVRQAESFLREKRATFTNYRLSEDPTVAYETLNFNTLPAVFLFGPDGKELRRFTWDDPNNQFTYDEVEKAVTALLDGR